MTSVTPSPRIHRYIDTRRTIEALPDGTADMRLQRRAILTRSPALTTTSRHVCKFAQILTERRGGRLEDWMTDVASADAGPLRSFANGLRHHWAAGTAELTLGYGSVQKAPSTASRRSSAKCTAAPT